MIIIQDDAFENVISKMWFLCLGLNVSINWQITGNWIRKKVLVAIVAADALVLKHQTISIQRK